MVEKQIKIETYWQPFAGGCFLKIFSQHGPVTLLSETNYAGCKSSSFSNRLCCCGSLEGRSFILLSTPICPQGFCFSVAESVPLHLPQDELVFLCAGECERWKERECVPACVQEWLHVLVAQYDLCASVWEHVCVLVHMQPSLHVLFPQHRLCLCSIHSRLMAYRSCNTFFSFITISKPHDSLSDILNYLFGLSASQIGKSERHNRTATFF